MPYDDYNDSLINVLNMKDKSKREAKKVYEELISYLNGVEPVNSLQMLLKDCRGETLEDKLIDYFVGFGGSEKDFLDIKGEQRAAYLKNKLTSNSVRSKGAETIEAPKKKKRVKKNNYRDLLITVLLIMSIIVSSVILVPEIIDEYIYKNAIETIEDGYLVENYGFSLEKVEKKEINDLYDLDVLDFDNYLKELGLSEYSRIFIVYRVCGETYEERHANADKLCYEYYGCDFNKFLRDNFPSINEFGRKYGDEEKLSNHCQSEITKKGLELSQELIKYKSGNLGGKGK